MNDATDTPAATLRAGDPRTLLAAAVMVTTPALAAIRPEDVDRPTPCAAMTVAQLAEHLVVVIRRIACAGRGEPLPAWPTEATDVPQGEWSAAFTAGAHDVQAAWPDETLDRPTQVPWGTFPGLEVLGAYTNELVVHTWDLARATDQHPTWAPEVLEFALEAMHRQLPLADRAPIWEATRAHLPPDAPWEDPFANAVEVPDDAPLIDRVVAWSGRTP